VDTGIYTLSSNTVISSANNGLTIVGANTNNSTSAAYTAQVTADGPLAYYRLGDAGGTAADSSGVV